MFAKLLVAIVPLPLLVRIVCSTEEGQAVFEEQLKAAIENHLKGA